MLFSLTVRVTRSSAWGDQHGAINRADEVTLSRKEAKSPTRGRKLRSTGTKAAARVSNGPNSVVELKKATRRAHP